MTKLGCERLARKGDQITARDDNTADTFGNQIHACKYPVSGPCPIDAARLFIPQKWLYKRGTTIDVYCVCVCMCVCMFVCVCVSVYTYTNYSIKALY